MGALIYTYLGPYLGLSRPLSNPSTIGVLKVDLDTGPCVGPYVGPYVGPCVGPYVGPCLGPCLGPYLGPYLGP